MGSLKDKSRSSTIGSPSIGGPTLKQRNAAGSQNARKKARFASLKETEGPRKGLTRALGAHGGEPKPMPVETRAAATAKAISNNWMMPNEASRAMEEYNFAKDVENSLSNRKIKKNPLGLGQRITLN